MINVRAAQSDDLNFIVQANVAMAEETEDKGIQTETLSGGIRYLLDHADEGFYLVAECNGVAAGTLMVTFEYSDWRNGRFWWIQSVYVMPQHRRQGVYTALHAKVLELARQDTQACGIRLYVEKENLPAQQTYQQLGMYETDYRLFETEFADRV